jgi:hypothetical protein
VNTLYFFEEWRGKQRISPLGDNFIPRGQNSPLGGNFTAVGQSLPLGAKLRMGFSIARVLLYLKTKLKPSNFIYMSLSNKNNLIMVSIYRCSVAKVNNLSKKPDIFLLSKESNSFRVRSQSKKV